MKYILNIREIAFVGLFFAVCSQAVAVESMVVNSVGNVGIGTSNPVTTLNVQKVGGKVQVENTDTTAIERRVFEIINNGRPAFRMWDKNTGGKWDFKSGQTFFIKVPGGGANQFALTNTGNLTISGSLAQGSSRSMKTNIAEIDKDLMLEKVMALPILEWSYITTDGVRHIGPMAEDFAETFGLGNNDKTLGPGDIGGVALAAIKGLKLEKDMELQELRQSKDMEIASLRRAIDDQKAQLEDLKELVELLTTGQPVAGNIE